MTKIDVKLSQKSNEEKLSIVDEISEPNEKSEKDQSKQAGGTPIVMVGTIGQGTKNAPNATKIVRNEECFDWVTLKRISVWQMGLSVVIMMCILSTMAWNGFNGYRFTQFLLALFMFRNAHCGIKASGKLYCHLIFFTIMMAIQWLITMIVVFCLAYTTYEAAYYIRFQKSYMEYSYDSFFIYAAIIDCIGTVAISGTIITGCAGLNLCCRGFGNILSRQEKFFKTDRTIVQSV